MSGAFVPVAALRRESEPAPAIETLRLRISGMHCASCVSRVESALASVPGVLAARVNLATQRAEADVSLPALRAGGIDVPAELPARLAAAVRAAGYDAFPVTSPVADDRERPERER